MGHWSRLSLRAEDGERREVGVWTKKFCRRYGAQIPKEHIETRRIDMVSSKSVQIWTRTEDITESETDTFECQRVIFEVS